MHRLFMFIYLKDRETSRDGYRVFFHTLVHFQNSYKARTGLGWSQEPGTLSWFPMWVVGNQTVEPSSAPHQHTYQQKAGLEIKGLATWTMQVCCELQVFQSPAYLQHQITPACLELSNSQHFRMTYSCKTHARKSRFLQCQCPSMSLTCKIGSYCFATQFFFFGP